MLYIFWKFSNSHSQLTHPSGTKQGTLTGQLPDDHHWVPAAVWNEDYDLRERTLTLHPGNTQSAWAPSAVADLKALSLQIDRQILWWPSIIHACNINILIIALHLICIKHAVETFSFFGFFFFFFLSCTRSTAKRVMTMWYYYERPCWKMLFSITAWRTSFSAIFLFRSFSSSSSSFCPFYFAHPVPLSYIGTGIVCRHSCLRLTHSIYSSPSCSPVPAYF